MLRSVLQDVGGLYSKLVTNVFVIPILFFCGCFVIYQQQKKTATMIIAGGGADESALTHVRVKFKQNVFVGIFLVYPTITSTLCEWDKHVPSCIAFQRSNAQMLVMGSPFSSVPVTRRGQLSRRGLLRRLFIINISLHRHPHADFDPVHPSRRATGISLCHEPTEGTPRQG